MNRGQIDHPPPPPTEKSTFKKPGLIRVRQHQEVEFYNIKGALLSLRQFLETESPLTLIWVGFLGDRFEVGGVKLFLLLSKTC